MIQVSGALALYPLSMEDTPDIFHILDKEREILRKWLPFVDKTWKEEDTAKAVEEMIAQEEEQFTLRHYGMTIGLIGFKNMDTVSRKIEIGYWLSPEQHGNGYMTEAVKAMIDHAFLSLNMNRIQIRVAVNNHRSNRIPRKLGFFLEGVERDGELLVDNVYTDINVYSMLKKDYKERIWK